MFAPIRLAAVLTTVALLAGCGTAPGAAPMAASISAKRVAAANFDRMEVEYSYRLGSKAAKAFLVEAEQAAAPYKALKSTCELTAKGGLFGTTIQVKLTGTMANVMALREALDALHKVHK